MKMRVSVFAFALFVTLLPAADSDLNSTEISSILDAVSDNDVRVMNDNIAQSEALLRMSQNLLSLSQQLTLESSNANVTYINAMLRLSDDIGKMADRIGEMADRIVATELQIGLMADRILETQRLQNENVALTQANLLKAQKNFNDLLIQLASN